MDYVTLYQRSTMYCSLMVVHLQTANGRYVHTGDANYCDITMYVFITTEGTGQVV